MTQSMVPSMFCDREVLAYRSSAPVDGLTAARPGDAILRPPERREWAAPPPRELQGAGPLRPRFLSGDLPARFDDDLTLGAKARLLRAGPTTLSASATLSAPLPAQTGHLRTSDALFIGYLTRELPLGLTADFNLGLNCGGSTARSSRSLGGTRAQP